MLWLLGLVFFFQSAFYWFLKPLVILTTPFFELGSIGWILLFIMIWLVSGNGDKKISN